MAPAGDAENPIITNEHTPLLDANHADLQLGQSEQKHNWATWYIRRIAFAIVAALILGIFVKGWIDAGGNVDVCATSSRGGYNSPTNYCFIV